MHSTVSDGSLSVTELVHAVKACGLAAFALTDHDSVDGMAEAGRAAAEHGLWHVSGVEISTRVDGLELHVLGYGFDAENPALLTALQGQKAARHRRIPKLVARLNLLGAMISVDDVYRATGEGNPGRPHVARALVAAGICVDIDDAFRRFLSDSGPANVPKPVPCPRDAIGWIHAAGGRAVWAHPLARPIPRQGGFDTLARELREAGLDGIEEIHPAQDPCARRRVRRAASELGLRVTGGSDFHGVASSGVTLGKGRGRDWVAVSALEALLA